MEIRTIRMDRLMIRYGLKIEMLLFMIIRVRSVLVNYTFQMNHQNFSLVRINV